MKAPAWFGTELRQVGMQVIAEDITRATAADRLTDLALKPDSRGFVRQIVWAYMTGKVRGWIDGYLGSLTANEIKAATGAVPLPYMDLPALLEISPGRFVHQRAVTRGDLKSAVVQAKTKASNAKGYADKVQRLASAALPLMPDDTTTLADISARLRLPVGSPA